MLVEIVGRCVHQALPDRPIMEGVAEGLGTCGAALGGHLVDDLKEFRRNTDTDEGGPHFRATSFFSVIRYCAPHELLITEMNRPSKESLRAWLNRYADALKHIEQSPEPIEAIATALEKRALLDVKQAS